jgi:hypothetical protein
VLRPRGEEAACLDCFGARAVPDITGDYVACPSCVIDAGETWVVFESEDIH